MPEESGSEVKYLVGRSQWTSALIAGFIATHVATVAGLWFTAVKLPKFDFNTLNGWIVFAPTGGTTLPVITFVVGGVVHYISGILWGLIFGLIIAPQMGRYMKGLAPMTPQVNLVKGIIWGVALWLISSAVWMPLVVGSIGIPVGAFLTNFGNFGVDRKSVV